MVTRIISDCTVMIRSLIGRMYKSNVARLRTWRGRDLTTETYGLGIDELLEESRVKRLEGAPVKRRPGRPRKIGIHKPVVKKEESHSSNIEGWCKESLAG